MKKCPFCDEQIENRAVECPFCKMDLTGPMHTGHTGSKSGVGMGVIIFAWLVGFGILAALFMPSLPNARPAARRSACKNNLKMIGLALHNYCDVYGQDVFGTFPPAYIADDEGNPMHSWRVLILPFLDQQQLYDSYDFTEPWDSPVNMHVLENMPTVYRCPSDPSNSTTTSYAAVFGPDCIFSGAEPVHIRQITDGTSNTLLVGEVSNVEIPWTKPQDVDITKYANLGNPDGFSSHHEGCAHFLNADGHVSFISNAINQKTLDLLYQRNDGKPISKF